jgi:hydroxyacylglutathione hydrolase
MLHVERLPVLSDNYIWLLHDHESGETAIVDPAVTDPVLAKTAARGWTVTQIWNTHWHPDHTGGNQGIKEATGCRISGPRDVDHPIAALDDAVDRTSRLAIGRHLVHVIDTPGHTQAHVCYYVPSVNILFTGDTLFAMGCGRLFEGTAEQMFENMRWFAQLPPVTQVYCAHEYSLSNGRFAITVEPGNARLRERMGLIEKVRAAGEATVPFSIAEELLTNPFLRARSAAELAELRSAKDTFKEGNRQT